MEKTMLPIHARRSPAPLPGRLARAKSGLLPALLLVLLPALLAVLLAPGAGQCATTSSRTAPTQTALARDGAPVNTTAPREQLKEQLTEQLTSGGPDEPIEDTLPTVMPPDEDDLAATADPRQPAYPGVANGCIAQTEDGKPQISLYYPIFGNDAVDEKIRKWASDGVARFQEQVASGVRDEGDGDQKSRQWELSGNFEITRPAPNIVSVLFSIYAYTGGSHGSLELESQSYDLSSGRPLQLADVFGEPFVGISLLSKLAREELKKKLGDSADEDMIKSGTEPLPENFTLLSFTPRGLYLDFPPYQVASWADGRQRLFIPLEKLATAHPRQTIWPNAPDVSDKQVK